MKIRHDQLNDYLRKGLAPVYLISGDEPLLVQEATQAIRNAAKQQGFSERMLFHADSGFDWTQLTDEANTLSLFASRRILEVRINNGKPSDKGNTIKALLANPSPDNIFLIICPRLDAASSRSTWVKAVESAGIFLPIWPIAAEQYPAWLKYRCREAGLNLDQAALNLFAQHTEGNLLAASQEIEKLKLLSLADIDADTLGNSITDNSRFNAYELADACITGKIVYVSQILERIRTEGVEPILVLAALLRKIRQLIHLKPLEAGQRQAAFKQQGIWPKQQGPINQALIQLNIIQLHSALQKALEVDMAIKGSGDNPWRLLHELVLLMAPQTKA